MKTIKTFEIFNENSQIEESDYYEDYARKVITKKYPDKLEQIDEYINKAFDMGMVDEEEMADSTAQDFIDGFENALNLGEI